MWVGRTATSQPSASAPPLLGCTRDGWLSGTVPASSSEQSEKTPTWPRACGQERNPGQPFSGCRVSLHSSGTTDHSRRVRRRMDFLGSPSSTAVSAAPGTTPAISKSRPYLQRGVRKDCIHECMYLHRYICAHVCVCIYTYLHIYIYMSKVYITNTLYVLIL